jgi:hypothetical protein
MNAIGVFLRLSFILCTAQMALSSTLPSASVALTGATRLKTAIGGHDIVLNIWTHKVDIGKMGVERPEVPHNACTYSRVPCSVVEALQIVVDDHAIFVPRSAFGDLSDVSTARIDYIDGQLSVVLFCGDASEAYQVRIEFNSTRATKRVLASGMDVTNPTEVTNYLDTSPLD